MDDVVDLSASDHQGFDLAIARSLQDAYDREAAQHLQSTSFSPTTEARPRDHHQHTPSSSISRSIKTLSSAEASKSSVSIVDKNLELVDPNPNIHQLFVDFDRTFFWGTLASSGVAVDWSARMTLCAGVCSYEGRGGFCSIRLSKPLLQFRPRRDLVETLLHEMIHAYLFVTHNNKDHDGHGPQFLSHMKRINDRAGTRINVYHNFHQEVRQFRQHWWKCNGPCQKRPPYFGLVMRAMNRAPSSRDVWWAEHQRTCGGTFVKTREPEGYGKKRKREGESKGEGKGGKPSVSSGNRDLSKMLGRKVGTSSSAESSGGKERAEPLERPALASSRRQEPPASEMRQKILQAAESRLKAAEKSGIKRSPLETTKNRTLKSPVKRAVSAVKVSPLENTQKRIQRSNSPAEITTKNAKRTHKDNSSFPICKKSCAEVKEVVVIDDESPLKPTQSNRLADLKSNTLVIQSDEETLADPTIYVEGETPAADTTIYVNGDKDSSQPCPDEERWFENMDDYKTCPVCGIGNIPAPIINLHISLCLDADEMAQFVDDEDA